MKKGMDGMYQLMRDICDEYDIPVLAYQDQPKVFPNDEKVLEMPPAVAIKCSDKTSIHFDAKADESKSYLIAHELGHILLGHFSKERFRKLKQPRKTEMQETEANLFAVVFMALSVYNEHCICKLDEIKRAEKRFKRLVKKLQDKEEAASVVGHQDGR